MKHLEGNMIDLNLAEQMRRNGATYQEIANHFGVTKQAIHLNMKNHGRLRRKYEAIFESCPYDNFRRWLLENKKVKISTLCKAIFGTNSDAAQAKTRRILNGSEVALTLNNIKRLEKFTGMGFDELFKED